MTSSADRAPLSLELDRAFERFDQRPLADAISGLLEVLREPDLDATLHFALLGRLGGRLERQPARTLALMAALARDGGVGLRLRVNAVQLLAEHDGEQLLSLGPALLSDPEPIVRAVSVSAIGKGSSPRALDLLLHALDDDAEYWDMWTQARVMDDAAVALRGGHWGPAAARVEAALRAWAERRVAEMDGPARTQATLSLGAIADPRALDALTELVAKNDLQALDLLVAYPRTEAVARLLAIVPKLPHDAAAMVAQALGQLRDPASIPALATMLADAASPVRWAAARGLRTMGSAEAWTVLERYADDPDPRVREYAAVPDDMRAS